MANDENDDVKDQPEAASGAAESDAGAATDKPKVEAGDAAKDKADDADTADDAKPKDKADDADKPEDTADDAKLKDKADDADEPEGEDADEPRDEDEGDDDEGDDEGDEPVAAAPAARAVHGDGAHGHDAGAHGHGDDLAHVTPVRLLVGIWASLSVLTILTVSVTHWDFGGQTNLVVAMIIATMKASLVVVFFMHLRWDRRFHALVFLSSLLFVILFIGLALTDRAEYQPNIDAYEAAQAAAAAQTP